MWIFHSESIHSSPKILEACQKWSSLDFGVIPPSLFTVFSPNSTALAVICCQHVVVSLHCLVAYMVAAEMEVVPLSLIWRQYSLAPNSSMLSPESLSLCVSRIYNINVNFFKKVFFSSFSWLLKIVACWFDQFWRSFSPASSLLSLFSSSIIIIKCILDHFTIAADVLTSLPCCSLIMLLIVRKILSKRF